MSGLLQYTSNLHDQKNNQLKLLLKDLDQIKTLTKIRGEEKQFNMQCFYCKIPHNLDGEHNLVIYQYTEAQFIADLISEFDTLYQICNWAHKSIGKQTISSSMSMNEKAWIHILSGEYDQANQYLNEEEKAILNSLRPIGRAENLFDFMKFSMNQSENWVLILDLLSQYQYKPGQEKNQLYQWALCEYRHWQNDFLNKFNENLWLNIRAELFYRVMKKHKKIYPKLRRCINFGINKSFIFEPEKYKLNCDFTKVESDQIGQIGKKFIIVIIKYLTNKNGLQQFIDIVHDAIETIQTQTYDQQAELRSNCYYEIGLMLSDLMDLDQENNFQFMEIIKILVNQIQNESIDHFNKLEFIIHLLSILSKNIATFGFIFDVCQKCIRQQGDSLYQFLEKMIKYEFERSFITDVAFEQFSNLSPAQQNELLSSEFEKKYFAEEELQQQIRRLLPQIVENMEFLKENFQELFSKYFQAFQDQEEYYRAFRDQDKEEMLRLLQKIGIPYFWFVKYITYILNSPNLEYIHIQRITEGVKINYQMFEESQTNKELLALIAKKLTTFKDFAHYLLN